MIKATRQKPTGFSDPKFYESKVVILGFCHGKHEDAFGYNRSGETVLAVYADEDGIIKSAPIRQFHLEAAGKV